VLTQKLVAAHEPVARHDCLQTKLSPDGRTLVCISWNEDLTFLNLALLDVESGAVLFEKKPFFEPTYLFNLMLYFNRGSTKEFLPASFSADGNTLLIGPGDSKLAFDLRTRTPIKISGDLKNKVSGAFAFEGNDRVAGISIDHADDSGVFSFPDGKRLLKTNRQTDNLGSVYQGRYAIIWGQKFAAGIGDFAANKILAASASPALVYGTTSRLMKIRMVVYCS